MNIARISPRVVQYGQDGPTFTEQVIEIGKEQGYLGLPIRVGTDIETGHGTMTSAWEPTPDELAKLNAGGKVHVQLLGRGAHPPIRVTVEAPPSDDDNPYSQRDPA